MVIVKSLAPGYPGTALTSGAIHTVEWIRDRHGPTDNADAQRSVTVCRSCLAPYWLMQMMLTGARESGQHSHPHRSQPHSRTVHWRTTMSAERHFGIGHLTPAPPPARRPARTPDT